MKSYQLENFNSWLPGCNLCTLAKKRVKETYLDLPWQPFVVIMVNINSWPPGCNLGTLVGFHCIFCATGIRYSVIIKLPCALLQTGHLETVHAPVADTVAYFADLDAPVVDTVTYFGGNHRSRVWKSLKLKKVYFPRTRTSWDKYMFNRIVFFRF